MQHFERACLEAVDRLGFPDLYQVIAESGYSRTSCIVALGYLRKRGYIDVRQKYWGKYLTTELGKIALAIVNGQEQKKRWQKQQQEKLRRKYLKARYAYREARI